MWRMREKVWTRAARLREGQRVDLRLRSWYDVADERAAINRSELDDEIVLLADPCWGEIAGAER